MERAPYAADPKASAGRLVSEAVSPTRSDFQRDRDRIIHSTAFRRLAHKTQVFVPHEGDHFRTRLTHSLEVGQLARAIARSLRLDEDLAETVALAHDLGHTPFGHTGEEVLDALMAGEGGFDHNAQTLRIVTALERRYAAFDGLNLTRETLEGLAKHNGPLHPDTESRDLVDTALAIDALQPLGLDRFAPAEAQAAALADDIAYNAHDLDDGLRAGLFTLAECRTVGFLADLLEAISSRHPRLDQTRVIHELTRRTITALVEDAIGEGSRRLSAIRSTAAVRANDEAVIAFSPPIATVVGELRTFLWAHMYRHARVVQIRERAASIVGDLFRHLSRHPRDLPAEWTTRAEQTTSTTRELTPMVRDYLAGMTDRYAVALHGRLFATTPDLRYRTA